MPGCTALLVPERHTTGGSLDGKSHGAPAGLVRGQVRGVLRPDPATHRLVGSSRPCQVSGDAVERRAVQLVVHTASPPGAVHQGRAAQDLQVVADHRLG